MVKRNARFICVLVAALFLLTAVLSGCGSANQQASENKQNTPAAGEETQKQAAPKDKPSIRFAYNWTGSDPKAPHFEPFIKEYAEKNKDAAEFKFEGTPGEEHRTKIKVDAAAGNLPDVFTYWLGQVNLQPLVNADSILDVSEYLKVSKTIKKEQFSDISWSFFDIGGKYYGIPAEAFKGFFLANKNLFAKYNLEYPKTYEELKAVAKVFNDNGIVPFSMGSKNGQPSHLFFSFLTYQFENGFKDAQAIPQTWKYNTDAVIKAARVVEDMKKNQIFQKDTIANGDWGPQLALYNEEKAAMVYEFPWMIGSFKPEIVEASECIDFPKLDGATVDPSTYTIGAVAMGICINKKAFEDPAKKDALVNFVDYLESDSLLGELAKGGLFPAKTVKLDPSTLSPLYAKAVAYTEKQNVYPHHESYVPDSNSYSVILNSLDELFAGAITADQYAEKTQKALDKAKK